MSRPTCATCRFWLPELHDGTGKYGRCRRFPPQGNAGFPIMGSTAWCGEWSPVPCDHEYPADWRPDPDYLVSCRKCGQLI